MTVCGFTLMPDLHTPQDPAKSAHVLSVKREDIEDVIVLHTLGRIALYLSCVEGAEPRGKKMEIDPQVQVKPNQYFFKKICAACMVIVSGL